MTITDNNIALVSIAVAETLRQLQEKKLLETANENKGKELLSIQDITTLFPNLSETAIRDAINGKGLKYIKMGKGGKYLIDRQDLEEFLDSQKQAEKPLISLPNKYGQVDISAIQKHCAS